MRALRHWQTGHARHVAPMYDAIALTYRRSLPAAERIFDLPLEGFDRLGIPVWQAALVPPAGPAVVGYGFGATREQAAVGAWGELCEEVHVGRHVAAAGAVRASYAELRRVHGPGAVADPLTLCLPAGSHYTADLLLAWIEARRWPTGETVLVPREWVAAYADQLAEQPDLITPITNGLGAGLDRAHALAHGLLEVIQRDGNVLTYRALDQGVVVDLDEGVPGDVLALFARYRAAGVEPLVKLASDEFGIVSLYVVGDDRGTPTVPIQVTSCGEAAHPDRDMALRKAALEFAGSRARKAATHGPIETLRHGMPAAYFDAQMRAAMTNEDEPRATRAMADWVGRDAPTLRSWLSASVFADRRRVRYADLPTVPTASVADAAARLAMLTGRLTQAGADILWVDCSPPGGEVHVVKVIVPGLESETMSYGRIGWRGVGRLRGRRDALILNAARDGAERVRLRREDEARVGGPAWFDRALAERMVGDLYPLYREPGPFAAQLLRESAHV